LNRLLVTPHKELNEHRQARVIGWENRLRSSPIMSRPSPMSSCAAAREPRSTLLPLQLPPLRMLAVFMCSRNGLVQVRRILGLTWCLCQILCGQVNRREIWRLAKMTTRKGSTSLSPLSATDIVLPQLSPSMYSDIMKPFTSGEAAEGPPVALFMNEQSLTPKIRTILACVAPKFRKRIVTIVLLSDRERLPVLVLSKDFN
jgi:hypothetical protein